MLKKLIAIVFICASVLVAATQGAQAAPAEKSETRNNNPSVSEPVGQVLSSTRQEEAELKRQEIEAKVAEKKAAITDKLSEKDAEKCEQRESTINSVLDNRVLAAEKHLENFKAIEDKLRLFVTEKNLDLDNSGLYTSTLDTTAAEALGAINDIQFNCEEASAAAPGALVKERMSVAKQALKDYRTAIKDYAAAIKAAATKQTETSQESAQ